MPRLPWLIRIERCLHPKIKEGIAKSLVYYFTIKEFRTYRQERYQGHKHVFDRFSEPLNVAHRGFSGVYPENTLPAFVAALAQGADVIELDVQCSAEGALVVCHDPDLLRLKGSPEFVRDLPLERLQIELGLLTLAEVFAALPAQSLINIEIKHESSHFLHWQTEQAVVDCVRAWGRSEQVVISAFNPMIVNRIRKLAPELATAYLITQTLTPLLVTLLAGVQARYLHVDQRYLNPRVMRALRRKGLHVLGYTLNNAEAFQWAQNLGLKGVITDFPDRWRAFCASDAAKPLPQRKVTP